MIVPKDVEIDSCIVFVLQLRSKNRVTAIHIQFGHLRVKPGARDGIPQLHSASAAASYDSRKGSVRNLKPVIVIRNRIDLDLFDDMSSPVYYYDCQFVRPMAVFVKRSIRAHARAVRRPFPGSPLSAG